MIDRDPEAPVPTGEPALDWSVRHPGLRAGGAPPRLASDPATPESESVTPSGSVEILVPVTPPPPGPVTAETLVDTEALPAPLPAESPAASVVPASAATQPAAPAAPAPGGAPTTPAPAPPRARRGLRLQRRRQRRSWKEEWPAWLVSTVVHVGLLTLLAVATVAHQAQSQPTEINAAPFDTALSQTMAEELVHVLAPVGAEPSDQAVGPVLTDETGGAPGAGPGLGTGAGAPTATPRLGVSGRMAGGGGGGLPDVAVVPQLSAVATMSPRLPTRDLGGGGGLVGDVTVETGSIGEALDQLAREILRHLNDHKLLVVWLFDESYSMKDDQQAVRERFDAVSSALKLNLDADKKSAGALLHSIVGFGAQTDPLLPKPTGDIDQIARAIEKIPTDMTGLERTCAAIQATIEGYSQFVNRDRRMLLVVVTDESGDDGDQIEAARQAAVSRNVPIYVIGRQAVFGSPTARLRYKDPVTGDEYWPEIRRGPESPGPESLQWDGLTGRQDEQPSGFAPYELARLVKETGGMYFLLPSEEFMRIRQREQKYTMQRLKEYVPDYQDRETYLKAREASELRRSLVDIVELTRGFGFRLNYPVDYAELEAAIVAEYPIVEERLSVLLAVEQRLRSLRQARDREPDRRWQAHYDLMLAQIVAYQIKAYEYRACLKEMVALAQNGELRPSKAPIPDQLVVEWTLGHAQERKAPVAETEKKVAEAEALLRKVMTEHSDTPWADLAQDVLDRGFGVARGEWHHNPQYDERARSVPKY